MFSVAPTLGNSSVTGAPAQAVREAPHVAVLELERRAERLEPGQVHVDRARTEVVASGQRNSRLAAPREQRTEHADRRAHALDEVIRRLGMELVRRAQRDGGALAFALDADRAEQLGHRRHVSDARDVRQHVLTRREQRRSHEKQSRVLRSRDRHFAGERPVGPHQDSIHAVSMLDPRRHALANAPHAQEHRSRWPASSTASPSHPRACSSRATTSFTRCVKRTVRSPLTEARSPRTTARRHRGWAHGRDDRVLARGAVLRLPLRSAHAARAAQPRDRRHPMVGAARTARPARLDRARGALRGRADRRLPQHASHPDDRVRRRRIRIERPRPRRLARDRAVRRGARVDHRRDGRPPGSPSSHPRPRDRRSDRLRDRRARAVARVAHGVADRRPAARHGTRDPRGCRGRRGDAGRLARVRDQPPRDGDRARRRGCASSRCRSPTSASGDGDSSTSCRCSGCCSFPV